MTSSKAGIHGEFSVQGREIWSMFLSVWIWCVSGEAILHNTIFQEYSLGGKEELSGVILGLSLPVPKWWRNQFFQLPHCLIVQCPLCVCLCVSVCPKSCAHMQGWILRSYRSVSKITSCSVEGWHRQLVELFPPTPHRLSFCLSVFLSWCWHR